MQSRSAWQESTRRGRSRVKIHRGCLQVFVCSGGAQRQCSTPRSRSRSLAAASDESASLLEAAQQPSQPLSTEQKCSSSGSLVPAAPKPLDTSGIDLMLPARDTLLQELERCKMQLEDSDAGAALLPPLLKRQQEGGTAADIAASPASLLDCAEAAKTFTRRRWSKRSLSADTWTDTATTASARSSPGWSNSPAVSSEAATTPSTLARWMPAANAQAAQAATTSPQLRAASSRRRVPRAATADVAGRRRKKLQEAQELFCEMLAPLPGKLCASTSCLHRGRPMTSPSPHRPRSRLPLQEVATQACVRQRSCPPLQPLNGCWGCFPGIDSVPSLKSRPAFMARISCSSNIACPTSIPEGLAVNTDSLELSFENASPICSTATSSQHIPNGQGADCCHSAESQKLAQVIAEDDASICQLLAAALAEPHTPESVVALPVKHPASSHEDLEATSVKVSEAIHMHASIDAEFCDMLTAALGGSCSQESSVASPTCHAFSRASPEQDVMQDCGRVSKLHGLSLNTEETQIDSQLVRPLTPESVASEVTEAPMLPGRSLSTEDKGDSDIQDDQARPSSPLSMTSQATSVPASTEPLQGSRELFKAEIRTKPRQDFAEIMAARRRRSEQSSFSVVLPCL